MKKKILSVVGSWVLIVSVFGLLTACSDGEHSKFGVLPDVIPVAAITKFQISKVGGADAPSKSVIIKDGDSVKLEWEVATAQEKKPAADASGSVSPKAAKGDDSADQGKTGGDSKTDPTQLAITLDSKEMNLHVENLEPTGSQVVEKVVDGSKFTLTAVYGKDGIVKQEVVTAVVTKVIPLTVAFMANNDVKAKIVGGEKVDLCWEVSREDATVSIVDSNGNTVSATEEATPAEGTEASVAPKAAATVVPESGTTGTSVPEVATATEGSTTTAGTKKCVAVTPVEDTTYYITAVAEGEESVRKEVSVVVEEALAIGSFTANPSTITGETDVTLSWIVTPATAQVTISGIEGTFTAENSTTVKVSTATTFTLTATADGKTIAQALNVAFPVRTEIALKVSDNQVIFAGETADITWDVTDATGAAVSEATVMVNGQQQPASGKMNVAPTETTEYTIEAVSPTAKPMLPKKVTVAVRSWKGPGANANITAVGVSAAAPDVIFAGHASKLAKDGGLSLDKGIGAGPVWQSIALPFMATFPKIDPKAGNNIDFFDDLDYPVNSIVVDSENASRVYVGTTGGVFYSDDAGGSWNTLVALLLNSDIAVPRTTCGGKSLAGWKNSTLHGLSQVCDIAVASTGRFIIATDMVVEYLPNGVDAYLKDKKANSWKGFDGVTYGKVSNDLEIAKLGDKEVLFVATSAGILKSMDLGDSYEALATNGAPTGNIYSVKVDEVNGKLYAGTDGKIFVCTLNGSDCASWVGESIGNETARVNKIAIDPVKAGGIFAASDAGVYYYNGIAWSDVTNGPVEKGSSVMSIATVKGENGKKGSVYIGTSKGVFMTTSDVVSSAVAPATTDTGTGTATPATPPAEPQTPATPTVGAVEANSNML